MSEDTAPRYEPYLTESTGHTFSLGMDGDQINHEHDNETEPSYFTDKPEYDLKKLQEEVRQNYSLGLHTEEDKSGETEPPVLTDPPEYDLDEVRAKSEQDKEEEDA